MEDKWIKTFQEKLGDYQLEMPAAAPRRRGRRIAFLLSGAAAATLATVLLLRMPDDGRQGLNGKTAQAGPVVPSELPAAIRPMLSLATRNPQPIQIAAQKKDRQEEPIVTTETVKSPEPESPITRSDEPKESVERVEPINADVPEPEEAVIDWNEEEPTHRRADISARLHVNPLGLTAESSNASPQQKSNGLSGLFATIPVVESDETNYFSGLYINSVNKKDNDASIKRNAEQSQVCCFLPVKTGLSVRISGTGRLSLESGLNYSFHRATATASYGLVPTSYQMDYRMHYIGIPVKGVCSLAEWRRLSLYAAAGGEVEWLAFGRLLIRESSQTLVDDRIQEHPFLFSLTGAGGLEFNFTPKLGLYAEPGIAWHATPKGNLPNYYRDHPLSFDLHLGLRFNL